MAQIDYGGGIRSGIEEQEPHVLLFCSMIGGRLAGRMRDFGSRGAGSTPAPRANTGWDREYALKTAERIKEEILKLCEEAGIEPDL